MSRDIIYLYCVTDKEPNLIKLQKVNNKAYTIPISGFYAVLGNVEQKDFGKDVLNTNINDIEWLTKYANLHEKVIESAMSDKANVIPFKFATLFYTEESLKKQLSEQKAAINENFKSLDNKAELGAKVFCSLDEISEEVSKNNPEMVQIENQISAAKPGKAYILKKKKNELAKNLIQQEILEYKTKVYNELQTISVSSKVNKVQPKELTGRKDEMIFNAVFLIDKKNVGVFREKVAEMKKNSKYASFTIEPTGPWPPYNFIRMNESRVENA